MANITLTPINGELRIHDLELGQLLGFARPSKIRELIHRHLEKLKKISILPTVGKVPEGGGRPAQEYYLDRKQAIFICMKSETDNAIDVQMDIVRVYDRYLSDGELPPSPPESTPIDHRELRNTFASFMDIANMCGFIGNHAILSADNAVRALTNISPLALMGQAKLIADQRGQTYCPQELGKLTTPPLSAIAINIRLAEREQQTKDENGHWIPTAASDGLYEWVDTGKRHNSGTPVKQLRWFIDILDAVDLRH